LKEILSTLFEGITRTEFIKPFYEDLKVEGQNLWNLNIHLRWRDVGNLEITSFRVSDIWALQYWWLHSLSHDNRRYHPLFPCDERVGMYIANHFKAHANHKDITFNAWLIKEEGVGFANEIIGHFYLWRCFSDKPNLGLGVADTYQGKKLGTLFTLIIIYVTKLLNKKVLWLTTDFDNERGYGLYKKMGFEDAGEIEVDIPADGYKRLEKEMKLDLGKYE
jgi:RimJ/RimL family protein N-acetyltransferase